MAQERTAASALGTQMTWSALADHVKAASNRVTILDGQMQKSIICNKRFMAYAPGAAGADGDGCIENQLIKQLNKRVDDLKTTVDDINTRLTKVEGEVVQIKGSLTELAAKVTKLTGRVDIAEADINKLERRVKVAEDKIAALDAGLKTEVAARKAGDKELNEKVREINMAINAIEADITHLETNVADIFTCAKRGMLFNGTKCVPAKTPAPEDMVITNYTKTFCTRENGPFNIVAKCKSDEVLMSCAGGPGDLDESHEYWILEPDFKAKTCTGRVAQPRCYIGDVDTVTKNDASYYSQVIVTAICAKK